MHFGVRAFCLMITYPNAAYQRCYFHENQGSKVLAFCAISLCPLQVPEVTFSTDLILSSFEVTWFVKPGLKKPWTDNYFHCLFWRERVV